MLIITTLLNQVSLLSEILDTVHVILINSVFACALSTWLIIILLYLFADAISQLPNGCAYFSDEYVTVCPCIKMQISLMTSPLTVYYFYVTQLAVTDFPPKFEIS